MVIKDTSYFFLIVLIFSILLGGLTGYFFNESAPYLKPLGDIFLNLIFTMIVPLIFFSVSSSIARAGSIRKLGKIFFYMTAVFLFTGIIAAFFMIGVVKIFPPAQGVHLKLTTSYVLPRTPTYSNWGDIVTVSNFSKLFSHENILALIIFSILVGIAVGSVDDKENIFLKFLEAGDKVFMRVFSLIMYYAPLGFFSYFAVLVHEMGPQIMKEYIRVMIIYYIFGFIYFSCAFTCYAYIAKKTSGIKLFWKNILLPSITSIATCSSAASIPANLVATQAMGVSPAIYETVIPLGAIIHKDGSVLGGIVKIAFLFSVFHLNFSGFSVLLEALCISLLVGTVMGSIPSGGMLGELLILNIYGFPLSALIIIAVISIIIDPLATMINVTGNTVSSMMIETFCQNKFSLKESSHS